MLAACAQARLPEDLSSLANSSGVWALVAFALSLPASDARTAALYGCVALIALLVGYVLGASPGPLRRRKATPHSITTPTMTSPDQYAEAERRADDDRPGAPEDDKRRSRPDARAIVAIAVAVCALTATAFVLVHSQELISVLP